MIKKNKHLLHTYLGFHSFVLWVWINNSMKYKQQWDIIDEAPYKIYWSPGGSWSVHRLHASETYQKYRHDQLYTSSNHRGCDMYKNAHTPCLLGASMLNSAALLIFIMELVRYQGWSTNTLIGPPYTHNTGHTLFTWAATWPNSSAPSPWPMLSCDWMFENDFKERWQNVSMQRRCPIPDQGQLDKNITWSLV